MALPLLTVLDAKRGLPDAIVLTTPWNAAEAAIRSMGDLGGKIILDATKPLAAEPDGRNTLIQRDAA